MMDGDLSGADRRASVETMDRPPAAPPAAPPPRRGGLRLALPVLLLAALAGGGAWYWWRWHNVVWTDDATIAANIHTIAPQIAGRVETLLVHDNEHVAAGQMLAEIDPSLYRVALDQARAARANAEAGLEEARARQGLRLAARGQARANVTVAEADLFQARQTYDRYRRINPRAITRQQLDNALAAFRSAEARVAAATQAVNAANADLKAAAAQILGARAALRTADVAVAKAKLDLSYATIRAPVAGRVTARSVQTGNYVKPGAPLMSIVSDRMWVVANFKETELSRLHPGQPVRVHIDAFPGRTFAARVESFQRGTGAAFSVIPVENATGNYVKVVQRLPVKIVFTDPAVAKLRLAPGMSVEPSVQLH